MATPPVFSAGSVLTAGQMNAVGLWLVKTDTITTGATKEITNAFSSDYENYRIVISYLQTSVQANVYFRFGTSTTGYYGTYYYDKFDGLNTGTVRKNNGGELQISITENLVNNVAISFDVIGPQKNAAHKGITGTSWGAGFSGWFAGVIANSTQYTSFTIGTASGSFSAGNVYVYGYRP